MVSEAQGSFRKLAPVFERQDGCGADPDPESAEDAPNANVRVYCSRNLMQTFRKVRNKPGCCPFCGQSLADVGLVYSHAESFLARGKRRIFLAPTHNTIIDLLIRGHPNGVTRERFEVAIWGFETLPDRHRLSTHLTILRKSLEPLGVLILYNCNIPGWVLKVNDNVPDYSNDEEDKIIRNSYERYRQYLVNKEDVEHDFCG